MSVKYRIWLVVALLVAFWLRVYLLDGQSLWNDEGTSVALASLNLPAIANGAAHDIHPPLYYYLLHFWMPVAGASEFAVRFLSVCAGVLVVAVTFRLARDFFDEEVGLIAAFLSGLSAFQLFYAQETRMYIWLTCWACLSAWFLMRGWFSFRRVYGLPSSFGSPKVRVGRPTLAAWLAYVLVTVAALYTHYFAFAILAFENLFFLGWLLVEWARPSLAARPRVFDAGRVGNRLDSHGQVNQRAAPALFPGAAVVSWLAAQTLAGLAFLPWFTFAGNQLTSWPAISEPLSLAGLLGRTLSVLATGGMIPFPNEFWIGLAAGVFFLGGFLRSRYPWQNGAVFILLLALWIFVPVLLLFAISIQRPAYNPKFLLLVSPAFFGLAARGLSILYPGLFHRQSSASMPHPRPFLSWRTPIFMMAVILSAGLVLALQNYYGNPAYARDNYRGAVGYINRAARAEDVVLVDAPGQLDVVRYYLRTPALVAALPIGRPPNGELTLEQTDKLIDSHRRLFALYYATEQSDPANLIGARLEEHAFDASSAWMGNLRLAQYGLPALMRAPSVVSARATFGGELVLDRFELGETRFLPGDILAISFHWRVLVAPSTRYKIFVHLLNSSGQVAAQHDAEPNEGTPPMTSWRAGENRDQNFGVVAGLELAPGSYPVEMGVYRMDTGQRLAISDSQGASLGDRLFLGQVTIGPPGG